MITLDRREPNIGRIGIYRGYRPKWWQYGVRWHLWSDFRGAKLEPAGEIGHIEMVGYIAWSPYRDRKRQWKQFYRGGKP